MNVTQFYPWYPYGWDNSDYGDNGGYNSPNDTSTGSTSTDTGNPAGMNNAPPPAPPVPAGPSAAAVAAAIDNAINNSPAMIAANQVVQNAEAAFNSAKAAALEKLKQQPEYQAAAARRHAAAQQLHAVRTATPPPQPADLLPPAQAKLEAGDEVTRMEEKAITADPAASTARKQLQDAVTKRDALRSLLLAQYQSH